MFSQIIRSYRAIRIYKQRMANSFLKMAWVCIFLSLFVGIDGAFCEEEMMEAAVDPILRTVFRWG